MRQPTRRVPLPRRATRFIARPQHGWFDRIKLRLYPFEIRGQLSPGELRTLRGRIRASSLLRSRHADELDCTVGGTSWLLSGQLKRVGNRVRLDLEFNPTRVLAARAGTIFRGEEGWRAAFTRRPDVSASISYETMDAADNFVRDEDTRLLLNFDWSRWTSQAVRHVVEIIAEDLGVSPEHPRRLMLSSNWDWKLRQIETYWEFDVPNAVASARELARIFRENASQWSVTFHDVSRVGERAQVSEQGIGNAWSSTIALGATGTSLVAYAKSFTRLRLEVRHLRPPRRIYQLPESSLSSSDVASLERMLAFVQQRSAERLTRFLATIEAPFAMRTDTSLADLATLLGIIAEHRFREREISELLTVLIAQGRVVSNVGHRLRPLVDLLVAAEVLRLGRGTHRPGTFVLISPYREALGRLAARSAP
ncbi:hypothetical protein [Flaviflagellibacter deserti]|uniref:Translation elongation factor SelB winged helix type 3 domain-containing protein n=1 Tax=Flaviflagellibacter deserti TaxID=2267266 RepID=A0ABV9YUJ6_9HYPH